MTNISLKKYMLFSLGGGGGFRSPSTSQIVKRQCLLVAGVQITAISYIEKGRTCTSMLNPKPDATTKCF